MLIRLCILGSGSSGNCTYIEAGGDALLIDAGLSARETGRRLEAIGAGVDRVKAICVSHEHSDHTTGLRVLHERGGVPVYANRGTADALSRDEKLKGLPWQVFSTGSPFSVGGLVVEPFSVLHDAYDPVGFVVSAGAARVAVVTDMGAPTTLVRERLRHCRAVVLESNHDEQMLKDADRPWQLKQRISGRQGHLSNQRAAELLEEIAGPELEVVYLAHLSEQCNEPALAQRTASERLASTGHTHVRVELTWPDRPSAVWQG